MQHLEVSCAVRPICNSLGFKGLISVYYYYYTKKCIYKINSKIAPTCFGVLTPSSGVYNVYTTYTGCPRRNGQNFGRVFLMLKYTDITQNNYIQS